MRSSTLRRCQQRNETVPAAQRRKPMTSSNPNDCSISAKRAQEKLMRRINRKIKVDGFKLKYDSLCGVYRLRSLTWSEA
jgi:hypothetical protein